MATVTIDMELPDMVRSKALRAFSQGVECRQALCL